MSTSRATLELSFDPDHQIDEDELQYLLEELRELDLLVSSRAETDVIEAGVRGGTVAEIAAVVIALSESGATLPHVVQLLQDWLRRRRSGSIRLKIGTDELVLTGVSDRMQQQALDEFIERHRR